MCWGYNQYGQLGDGGNADRWSPTQIAKSIIVFWSTQEATTHAESCVEGDRMLGPQLLGPIGDGPSRPEQSILTVDLGPGRTAAVDYSSAGWSGTPPTLDAIGTQSRPGPTAVLRCGRLPTLLVVPAFEYTTTILILTNNQMTPQTPSVNCTWCTFAIHPSLPTGLTFDTSSGALSGEPENAFL